MGKRLGPRKDARLQLRIAGVDAGGHFMLQAATTRNISWHGAVLEGVQRKLKVGEIISITNQDRKARFRVLLVDFPAHEFPLGGASLTCRPVTLTETGIERSQPAVVFP